MPLMTVLEDPEPMPERCTPRRPASRRSWSKPMQLYGKTATLMPLMLPEQTATRPVLGGHAGQHRLPQASLLGRDLERETRELIGLLVRQAPHSGGTRTRIGDHRQRRLAIGEPADNGRDGAAMTRAQAGIDGGERLGALGALNGGLQLRFSGVDRRNRAASGADRIGLLCSVICGLAGFGGSLARPFQRSRYRSRPRPLPRSRSVHQAWPSCSRSASMIRATSSMMRA